jgi:hypothetical protein
VVQGFNLFIELLNAIKSDPFALLKRYGRGSYITLDLVICFSRILTHLHHLSIDLVLDEPINVVLFAEVPYFFAFDLHGVHMVRREIVIVAVALLYIL